MAHIDNSILKQKFEDGDRPVGEDFANLLDSCHNTIQDTPVNITETLTVDGGSTFKDNVNMLKDLATTGDLTIDGRAILKDTLSVYQNTSLNGELYVAKDTRLNQTLTVTGVSTLKNDLTVEGAADLNTLNVGSDITGHGNLVLDGTSIFNDTVTINGRTTFNADLDAEYGLNVEGIATFNNTVISNAGSLTTGNAIFNDSVHIKGDLHVDGNAYLSAGEGGNINVGDSNSDNVLFKADIDSNILPNTTETNDLGSTAKQWKNLYTKNVHAQDIIVTNNVDGRDISSDGDMLDSIHNTTHTNSANWSAGYSNSLNNAIEIALVGMASGGWNQTEDIVNGKMSSWDDVISTVDTFSASWEESADIQAVANDVATVGAVSADWSDSRTTVRANSAVWNKTKLVEFIDVNPAGLSNNSILRYDGASDTWVASTTEDTKSSGSITVLDGNNTAWGDASLILVDNDAPANTVTFIGDLNSEHGNNFEVNNFTYKFGYGNVVTNSHAAEVIANVINFAAANGDLAVTAEAVNGDVNLSQNNPGEGGNTSITGTLLNMGLISVTNFTGGENPDAFEHLDDTPASYGGNSGKFVKVNSGEDGLEFIEDDTRTTVNTFSASWEESADIQEVADDVAIVGAASGDWNDTRTSLVATSGDWNDARTSLVAASGDWNESQTVVNNTSADWNESTTVVNDTSADWSDARSSLMATSGDWNDARTSLVAASGDWNESQTVVNNTSGEWDSVYSWVNSDSATNNSDYNQTAFVNASGDEIVGTLNITGDLSARGDVYLSDSSLRFNGGEVFSSVDSVNAKSVYTHISSISGAGLATVDAQGKLLVDQIPELSITRVHTANNPSDVQQLSPTTGIQVGDVVVVMSTHDNLIALVDAPNGIYDPGTKDYTGYAKLAMPDGLVQTVNGKPGPSVVLNPDDLLDDSTAHKFVSQQHIDNWNDTRTTLGTTSGSWNDTRTTLGTTSADWSNTRTTLGVASGDWNDTRVSLQAASGDWNESQAVVNTTSGDWNESQTVVNNTSADWSDTRTTLNTSSGDWYDTRSSVMGASGSWDSVYSFVNADSATNNSTYNDDTYVNASGDTMTGNLDIDGGELIVGGNITMAGDLIHQNDTGTRISFNDDIISLETNGQEFITIDGTAPTPDAVIINDPAAKAIHFQIKSPTDSNLLVIDGSTDQVGIGTGTISNGIKLEVNGDAKLQNITAEEITAKHVSVTTGGSIVSAGTDLLDIFSTDTDIHGDLTVHGSVSSRDEAIVAGSATVSGTLILGDDIELPNSPCTVAGSVTVTDGLSGRTVTAQDSYTTFNAAGERVFGATQDVNIGGHVLHIVNGIIVKVTDE
jgi:hypothetical protein